MINTSFFGGILMRFSRFPVILTVLFAVCTAFAQTPTPSPDEEEKKLTEKAVELMKETVSEIGNMRTPENRISFMSEAAALMWYHDDRQARPMFGWAVNEFKTLITGYNDRMNMLPPATRSGRGTRSFLFGAEPDERSRLMRKFQVAIGVRERIASTIAEHEPVLAFNFYHDSVSGVSNPELIAMMGQGRQDHVEAGLLEQIAQKDAAKAVELSRLSLRNGYNPYHLNLLRSLNAKDPEKAVEFASAILSQIKNESTEKVVMHAVHSLLVYGGEMLELSREDAQKPPIYSVDDLREISEILARAMLEGDEKGGFRTYAATIEKYNPGRALQIRAKFNIPAPSEAARRGSGIGSGTPAAGYPRSSMTGSGNRPRRNDGSVRAAEDDLIKEFAELAKKDLSKDERAKILEKARETLMSTPGTDKKIIGLSAIATVAAKAGDKELAAEIMRDAAALVPMPPKTYLEFLHTWMLVSGYAEADPEKAFPILEDTILRGNELITAFIKVGEFMEVTEQMIVDGEAQVGVFGGGLIGDLSRQMNMAESSIRSLLKADFERTKMAADRFDRVEMRVLAKMIILRSVLGQKPAGPDEVDLVGTR